MIVYVKHFDSNKTMSLKVNDNRLLKKYTKISEKVQQNEKLAMDVVMYFFIKLRLSAFMSFTIIFLVFF